MEQQKKTKKGLGLSWLWVGCFAVIAGAISLLIYSVFNQTETVTSTTKTSGEMGVLECKTTTPKEPFFTASGELKGEHKVKVMMRDDKANEISFEYEGTFEDETKAKAAESTMHADYNIYMGSEAEKLSPVFGVTTEGVLRISMYAGAGKLNSVNAKIFFMTTDEMLEFYGLSRTAIEKIYKNQGFSCSYSRQ